MKTDFLKELGLEQEVISKIMAENGKDIEKYKAENETLKAESEQQKTQLTEANKQIESFKGMDIEGIKKAADDWKTQYETAKSEAEKQINTLKLDSALDKALLTAKAKNPKLAKAALNMELIKLDGDNILGLNEQLDKLKESDGYLFDTEPKDDPNNSSFRMNSGGEHKTSQDVEYDKMSDEEYYKTTLKKE